MKLALTCVVFVLGCGTPYQEKGLRGGYADRHLSDGRYAIDVEVNSFTSQGRALEYAHRRADELCPTGYDVVDGAKSQRHLFVDLGGGVVEDLPKANVALIVQCTVPAVASQQPANERRVMLGDAPIYCGAEACSLVKDRCEDMNDGCEARAGAACFTATATVSGKRATLCAPSVAGCEARLDTARRDPDLVVTTAACGIYRARNFVAAR